MSNDPRDPVEAGGKEPYSFHASKSHLLPLQNRFARVRQNLQERNWLMLKKRTVCWQLLVIAFATTAIQFVGCAEGPLWRSGKYSPWARSKWAAEEQIADTFFARKRTMTEAVASVVGAPVEDQQRVAQTISEVVLRDPVLLLRLHGVNLLGKLSCPLAIQTLQDASKDNNPDIRIAAVKSWQAMESQTAISQLQNIIGSDTNIDVRLAATRALSNFSGQQAVSATSLALDDQDPALQLRAVESLQKITGEPIGRDVSKWKQYVGNLAPSSSPATFQVAAESVEPESPSSGSQTRNQSTTRISSVPEQGSSSNQGSSSTYFQ